MVSRGFQSFNRSCAERGQEVKVLLYIFYSNVIFLVRSLFSKVHLKCGYAA